LYLEKGPGILGPLFDLYHVYRYTHGEPEQVPADGYFEQLHKSLFDAEEVNTLVRGAGFPSCVVFSYRYPGEGVAVCLGVYATKTALPVMSLQRRCVDFLQRFDGHFITVGSVEFLEGESGGTPIPRPPGSRARQGVRRVSRAMARSIYRALYRV
jgi:hypothetical protein